MGHIGRCKNCQRFFKAITRKTKYCSDKCLNTYHYRQKNKKKNIQKYCKKCGKEFYTTREAKIFCTILCKNLFHKQGIIKIKYCKYKPCSKKFETTNNSKEYCCNEHYLIAKRKRDKEYYVKHKIS